MNDLMRLAMERAVKKFGNTDSMFDLGNLAHELSVLAEVKVVDSEVIRALLTGRDDVMLVPGGLFRLED